MVRAGSAYASSGVTLAALAVAALLTGCASQGDSAADGRGAAPTTTTATSQSRVVAPGRPGETAEVIEPGEPFEVTGGGHNEVDISFVEHMIPHHRQALKMAELAPDRASDSRVLALAERVMAAQGPELVALEGWLTQRGLPVPEESTGGEHSHGSMPGMVTPFQMQLLEDSEGREFDELFLVYMGNHHAGAVGMAEPVALGGLDTVAIEVAADISVTQSAEINRMRDILDDL